MALTANMGTNLAAKFGNIQTYTAGAAIYRGATVALKLTDGKVYPAEADSDDSEKYLVVGFAMEAAAVDGDEIRVRQDGKLKRGLQGVAVAGKLACVYDDETVQVYDSTHKIIVGRINELIGSTGVYVDLEDRPARLASSEYD